MSQLRVFIILFYQLPVVLLRDASLVYGGNKSIPWIKLKKYLKGKRMGGIYGVGYVDVDGQLFSFVFVKIKKFVTYM